MGNRYLNRRAVLGGLVLLPLGGVSRVRAELALTRRNLAGVWRGTYQELGAVIAGEILFQPNGSFRHTQVWGNLMAWAAGEYKIAQNWIHFNIETYGPEEYKGVKQYRPQSETWMVNYFDGRTIRATIGDQTVVRYEKVS